MQICSLMSTFRVSFAIELNFNGVFCKQNCISLIQIHWQLHIFSFSSNNKIPFLGFYLFIDIQNTISQIKATEIILYKRNIKKSISYVFLLIFSFHFIKINEIPRNLFCFVFFVSSFFSSSFWWFSERLHFVCMCLSVACLPVHNIYTE